MTQAEQKKAWRARKKASGVCRDCSEPAVSSVFCEEHLTKSRLASATLRLKKDMRGALPLGRLLE